MFQPTCVFADGFLQDFVMTGKVTRKDHFKNCLNKDTSDVEFNRKTSSSDIPLLRLFFVYVACFINSYT